jgi:hypothetical protein
MNKNGSLGKNLLTEMCARTIEKILKKNLRHEMVRLAVPAEEPYRAIILDYFNNFMINNKGKIASNGTKWLGNFWSSDMMLKYEMKKKFGNCFTEQEERRTFDLRLILDVWRVLERISKLGGIIVKPEIINSLKKSLGTGKLEIISSDIEMNTVLKEMDFIFGATAKLLWSKAQKLSDKKTVFFMAKRVSFIETSNIESQ